MNSTEKGATIGGVSGVAGGGVYLALKGGLGLAGGFGGIALSPVIVGIAVGVTTGVVVAGVVRRVNKKKKKK